MAPEEAVVVRDPAQTLVGLETMTPQEQPMSARASVVVTDSALKEKDSGLLLLLPTPPRSGERVEAARQCHPGHAVMHKFYAQSRLQTRTHVQDSTSLALAAQTLAPKATANPDVMLSTPTSIKAAKGLLQLSTI